MKSAAIISITVAALCISPLARAEEEAGCAVTVAVHNVRDVQGAVLGFLHQEAGWGGAAVASVRVSVEDENPVLCFRGVTPGRYAVKLFHDRNGDGELATNMFGIPSEPYGFSNNAPAQFGPPAFAEAAFDVGAAGASQSINLN